jgi:hypothetical protein
VEGGREEGVITPFTHSTMLFLHYLNVIFISHYNYTTIMSMWYGLLVFKFFLFLMKISSPYHISILRLMQKE